MGGFGSGHGAKGLTSDYRALDVRQLGRLGRLTPGQAFDWSWTRDGKTVGVIRVRTEADRAILIYKHRSGGEEWKDEQYPVRIVRTRCNPWWFARLVHLPGFRLRASRG